MYLPAMTGALFGFAMGFIGSMPLTGPVAVLVFQRGLFGRFKDGLAVAVGCAAAECVYCGLAVAGFGTLLETYEVLQPISRGISVVVLLALGVWFARAHLPEQMDEVGRKYGVGRLLGSFNQGFWITAVNPVIVLNWSASIAILYSVAKLDFGVADKVLFPVAAGVGIVAWFAVLLAILRKFGGKLPAPGFRFLVRAMGVALVVFALWLAWDVGRTLLGGS
jgi:threonine/homoserine/homoserine lactone efflux protein